MPKSIYLRNVPNKVHGTLKARAAREGISLSALVKRELAHIAELPTMQEWLDRVGRRKPIRTKLTGTQIVRQLRDAGDRSVL